MEEGGGTVLPSGMEVKMSLPFGGKGRGSAPDSMQAGRVGTPSRRPGSAAGAIKYEQGQRAREQDCSQFTLT